MKKRILLAFIYLLSISTFALPSTIRFGTEGTYPPFEYVDATGEVKGFDIEIAQALCFEMKVSCVFKTQAFNSLIPSLKLGKFDAIIASIGVTEERKKQVNFTQSYYEPSATFVAATNKNYTLQQLPGKIIAVQQGTTFEKYLHDKYANQITVKTYVNAQDAFLDLIAGRVDIVLVDTPIATKWMRQANHQQQYSFISKPIIDSNYFGSGYSIAVKKNNTELLTALNNAITAIKENGKYQAILKKYFGEQ